MPPTGTAQAKAAAPRPPLVQLVLDHPTFSFTSAVLWCQMDVRLRGWGLAEIKDKEREREGEEKGGHKRHVLIEKYV